MTTPWPKPDYTSKQAMCCLCFDAFPFSELSRTPENKLTDICMDCRFVEIQFVLLKLRMV